MRLLRLLFNDRPPFRPEVEVLLDVAIERQREQIRKLKQYATEQQEAQNAQNRATRSNGEINGR